VEKGLKERLMKLKLEPHKMSQEEAMSFIANTITQKLLNYYKGKREEIRPTLGSFVHMFELQNIVIAPLLLDPKVRETMISAGIRLGEATAAYLSLCPDLVKHIKNLKEEKVEHNKIFDFLQSSAEITRRGKLSVKEFSKKRIVIHVGECAISYGINLEMPVCHFDLGFFIGFFQKIFEKELVGMETRCMCVGDEVCEFLIWCAE
jgi:predicted hydrocarbon binding protein